MPPEEIKALEIRGLCFRHGMCDILRNINLSIAPGIVCGLLGPNGSGKTTLFRCCLNFQKVHAGNILMSGQRTLKLSPARLSRMVSYVPQEHHAAFPFQMRELVSMGRNPHMSGLFPSKKGHEEATRRALDLLGIQHLADRTYSSLSGGQKQLALIARAVAQEAPLMLLDEPTSALDFQNQIEVWKALRGLAKLGFTIVVCCHDPNHILWFCDQAILLKDGAIIDSGRAATVINKITLERLYGNMAIHNETVKGVPVVLPIRDASSRSHPAY